MGAFHRTGAQVKRRAHHLVYAQCVYTGNCPHHIQDGIHGPDFVEVNRIDRGAVHAGLGTRQPIEHLETRLFNGCFQITGVDDGLDIGQMPVVIP